MQKINYSFDKKKSYSKFFYVNVEKQYIYIK